MTVEYRHRRWRTGGSLSTWTTWRLRRWVSTVPSVQARTSDTTEYPASYAKLPGLVKPFGWRPDWSPVSLYFPGFVGMVEAPECVLLRYVLFASDTKDNKSVKWVRLILPSSSPLTAIIRNVAISKSNVYGDIRSEFHVEIHSPCLCSITMPKIMFEERYWTVFDSMLATMWLAQANGERRLEEILCEGIFPVAWLHLHCLLSTLQVWYSNVGVQACPNLSMWLGWTA